MGGLWARRLQRHVETNVPYVVGRRRVLTSPRLVLFVEHLLRLNPCTKAVLLSVPTATVVASMRAKGGAYSACRRRCLCVWKLQLWLCTVCMWC